MLGLANRRSRRFRPWRSPGKVRQNVRSEDAETVAFASANDSLAAGSPLRQARGACARCAEGGSAQTWDVASKARHDQQARLVP